MTRLFTVSRTLGLTKKQPWKSIANLSTLIEKLLQNLGADYTVIGADVNIEAGAILANHYNEREEDTVYVILEGVRDSSSSRPLFEDETDKMAIASSK